MSIAVDIAIINIVNVIKNVIFSIRYRIEDHTLVIKLRRNDC